jgi:hypothetical protein
MPPLVLHRRRLGADLNRIGSRQFELSLCTLLKLAHLVGGFSLRRMDSTEKTLVGRYAIIFKMGGYRRRTHQRTSR